MTTTTCTGQTVRVGDVLQDGTTVRAILTRNDHSTTARTSDGGCIVLGARHSITVTR